MPPAPSRASTRCGPMWAGSEGCKGFIGALPEAGTGSGEGGVVGERLRVEKEDVSFRAESGDHLALGVESHGAGQLFVLCEFLAGLHVPQSALVVELAVRACGLLTDRRFPRLGF